MTDYEVDSKYLNKTVKTLQEMREKVDSEVDSSQDILNARRQASYDMTYQDWANNSIRVMASYTVLLVILFIVVFVTYLYGSQVKNWVVSTTSNMSFSVLN